MTTSTKRVISQDLNWMKGLEGLNRRKTDPGFKGEGRKPVMRQLRIFSGNANRPLADSVADYLGISIGKAHVGRFPDGEVEIRILENVRGQDVFIIQPTSHPANENLMELSLIIDALRRASASRITPVISYFGYGRQDRKAAPRVPISSKLV